MTKHPQPLLTALWHIRRKAQAVRDCRDACRVPDPAAAHALNEVLCETLEHASMLERALYGAGISPALSRSPSALPDPAASPRRRLLTLAQDERIALTRQVLQLRELHAERENRLLLRITREQAVHLRLFETLAGRM